MLDHHMSTTRAKLKVWVFPDASSLSVVSVLEYNAQRPIWEQRYRMTGLKQLIGFSNGFDTIHQQELMYIRKADDAARCEWEQLQRHYSVCYQTLLFSFESVKCSVLVSVLRNMIHILTMTCLFIKFYMLLCFHLVTNNLLKFRPSYGLLPDRKTLPYYHK